MKAVLFVSNGHGEIAIAARIAREVEKLADVRCDHLALVGSASQPPLHDVGPGRAMPSGGMIAMGNVRNILRDLGAGLGALTVAQLKFLAREGKRYDAVAAVGDAYALFMARRARRPTLFAGTAKSVYVAPYGPLEISLMRGASAVFVRDEATARRLEQRGLHAVAANVMADLGVAEEAARPNLTGDPLLAIFPGSRASAYENAAFLGPLLHEIHAVFPGLRALVSVAPSLSAPQLAQAMSQGVLRPVLRDDVREPFSLYDGEVEVARAWSGEIGAAIEKACVVLGQAGTANEAAAAAGVPVVAFEDRGGWYRRRQAALLDGALRVFPRDVKSGTRNLATLLRDPNERAEMSRIGRERLGPPGAARSIAQAVVKLCA